jgi:hypothetical protein
MPDSQSSPFDSHSLTAIERPKCPKCSTRMSLARISPAPGGYDLRTFECTKCKHVHKTLVALDPMKSGTANWQHSPLKPPE